LLQVLLQHLQEPLAQWQACLLVLCLKLTTLLLQPSS
jgi:hypothetical protein